MKLLVLTQYFPPETGAPQNRLFSLATYFAELGAEVSILTAMPNYPKMEIYEEYKGKTYVREQVGALTVHRSWIYVNGSKNFIPRLLNYFSFVFTALYAGLFKVSKHDLIICESPPLFLGITALLLKWFRGSKLIFNVSDLWPESAEKLGIVNNKLLLSVCYKLEKLLYRQSVLVSGQTQGIVKSINDRFPDVPTYWLPNGIDFNQFNVDADPTVFRQRHGILPGEFVLMYAGIIGYAQGLDVILDSADLLRDNTSIRFFIIGDGPEKLRLENKAGEMGLSNVTFIGNIPRAAISEAIAGCNAYIVPLKKNDLFLGAIPSKLFEPLAMGKPILLGVDGEARELFIEKGRGGLYYEPENHRELAAGILKLAADSEGAAAMGLEGKSYIARNFNRKNIAASFFKKLKEIAI